MLRKCRYCENEYPATDKYFAKDKYYKYGITYRCLNCKKEKDETYRQEHAEELKQYRDNYYRENIEHIKGRYDKQKKKIYNKQYRDCNLKRVREEEKNYYQQNKEVVKQKRRLYYEQHKDKVKAITGRYQRTHSELTRMYRHRRKTKELNLPNSYCLEQWQLTKQYFNKCCAYCGKEIVLQQDHFIPLSRGGEYTINNIIPACKSCNSSKNDGDFFEWYSRQKFYSKKRESKILRYLNYRNGIQQLQFDVV